MRKHWKIISASVGAVLVAASLLLAFLVGPWLARLPSDTDTNRTYSGKAAVLLNPTVVTGGAGPLILRNVPIQLTHSDKVVKSNGSAAAVVDTRTVTPAGGPTEKLPNTYIVDRYNLGPSTSLSYPGSVSHSGLTFNWPIGTNKHDYTGWVPDTQTTVTLRYAGTATRGGVDTYVYKATVPTTPIREPAQLAALPTSVPKSSLPGLAAQLGLPASVQSQLTAIFNKLPANLPLGYTYASTSTFWIQPTTGVIVDQQTNETRQVVVPLSIVGRALPIAPLSQFSYAYTPSSVSAAADDATSHANSVDLLEFTLPLILGIVGGVLLVAAGVGWLLASRRPPSVTPPAPAPAQPVGGPSI